MDAENVYLTAVKNNTEAAVQSKNPDGAYVKEVKAGAKGDSIPIMIEKDASGGEQYTEYKGTWNYQNCDYELGNVDSEEELIKILENMQYSQ